MPTDQARWDRLRAALDGWEAPRGLRLSYAIDERAARLAINLMATGGGGGGWEFSPVHDEALDAFIAQIPCRLDYTAFEILHDHICCEGRPPRLLAYGERVFRRWVDRYRSTLHARRTRKVSPWRPWHG